MVARITLPLSFRHCINYHERKVNAGIAQLIGAGNFLRDVDELTLLDKFNRFERLHVLNKNTRHHTLHAYIGFHPVEKLSNVRLMEIASDYMECIGFAGQPFLVYRHLDAGHPHLHVVSSVILGDGRRVNSFNIGKDRSGPATRELEKKYELVRARGPKIPREPLPVQKLEYGKVVTFGSILNAVGYIVSAYNFTSLVELSAILRLYNLRACLGKAGRPINVNKGILYQMLDENGKGRGARVKGSRIPGKPTLAGLEKKFAENELKRTDSLARLAARIYELLQGRPTGWNKLADNFRQERIDTFPLMNSDNIVYDLVFIDQIEKVVVLGSSLGGPCTVTAVFTTIGLDRYLQPAFGRIMEEAALKPCVDPKLVSLDASRALKILEHPDSDNLPRIIDRNKRKKRSN